MGSRVVEKLAWRGGLGLGLLASEAQVEISHNKPDNELYL